MLEIAGSLLYYVFVEEEHNGSRIWVKRRRLASAYGWGRNRLANPGSWTFYGPLASYHLKASTFGFADGHADRRKWMDKRTLAFIRQNAEDPSSHSSIMLASPDNEDIHWLIEYFISKKRVE